MIDGARLKKLNFELLSILVTFYLLRDRFKNTNMDLIEKQNKLDRLIL